MKPMHLLPVDKKVLVSCVESPDWTICQKINGRRALVTIDEGHVSAVGRDGQPLKMGRLMDLSLRTALPNGLWYIDGEIAKTDDRHNYFFAFDLPRAGDLIRPTSPFSERLKALQHIAKLAKWDEHAPLGVVRYAMTRIEKAEMVTHLAANHAEGVVLRKLSAPYQEGVRGWNALKFKFVLDADCVVTAVKADGKDNIVLGVYKDGKLVDVGKCTAMAGEGTSVKVGDVVTVRYLYVSEDGKLVQPTYPLIRKDKKPEECLFEQLVPESRVVLMS